jgi:hypothetical protein
VQRYAIRGASSTRLAGCSTTRSACTSSWYFEVDETYDLFDFDIEAAVLGLRDNADEWPPRYQSWATD